ncbi:hypothetical protein HK104_000367 [Borealophlyctis nickersoniae]|nr:hypothetical protein HK104_000367 [Borealophlyctis nickersoniae]
MSITSDEINYLVYRYLLESGFTHSSFAFQAESAIHKTEIKGANVRPGAMISLLQKGLQYIEVETHTNEDGTEKKCTAPFSLLGTHVCEIQQEDEKDESRPTKRRRGEENGRGSRGKDDNNKRSQKAEKEKRSRKPSGGGAAASESSAAQALPTPPGQSQSGETDPVANDDSAAGPNFVKYSEGEVSTLEGHTADIFVCSWNPVHPNIIATGSGDGTARIWQVADKDSSDQTSHKSLVCMDSGIPGQMDVTTIDWNPSGEMLATGSFAGEVQIWDRSGNLKFTLRKHTGPIFTLCWNKKGDLLLTAADTTAIVWDSKTGEPRQQFQFQPAATLDVGWKDDLTFAKCGQEPTIYVCQLGLVAPLRQFKGHQGDVNGIKWDQSGTYLASFSDDTTAKVWTTDSDDPICTCSGHTDQIYALAWSPEKYEGRSEFDPAMQVIRR